MGLSWLHEGDGHDKQISRTILSLISYSFCCLWLNRNEVRFHDCRAKPPTIVSRVIALTNEIAESYPSPEKTRNICTMYPQPGNGIYSYILQCDKSFTSLRIFCRNQIYLPLCCKLIASCGPIESPNGRGSRCPGGAETHRGTAVAPPLDPN